jgi:hypothetical protein
MLFTAPEIVRPYTRIHEAKGAASSTKGDTTMTNLQTNQIENLSDAELDNVAGGGFNFFAASVEVGALHHMIRHPIDNAGQIARTSAGLMKNILGGIF